MNQIRAKEVSKGDVLIRFGHRLEVVEVEKVIHPATQTPAVRITHEQGIVHYSPEKIVEIA